MSANGKPTGLRPLFLPPRSPPSSFEREIATLAARARAGRTDESWQDELDELASRARAGSLVLDEGVEEKPGRPAGTREQVEPAPEVILARGPEGLRFYVPEERVWDLEAVMTASAKRPKPKSLPRDASASAKKPPIPRHVRIVNGQVLTAAGRPVVGVTWEDVERRHRETWSRRRAGDPAGTSLV